MSYYLRLPPEDAPWWGWAADHWLANHMCWLWNFAHAYLCPGCWRERSRDAD